MSIVSTDVPTEQHPRPDNVSPIRFARVFVDLLPILHQLPSVQLRTYLELASRCDNWKRRNIAPPFIRAAAIATAVGASPRRVQLAIIGLLRLGLVSRIGSKARGAGGCQYEITAPDIFAQQSDPCGSHSDPTKRSPTITFTGNKAIRTDHFVGDPTLLVSRSIDLCQPRSRERARAGGPSVDFRPENNLDALEQEIVRLFDPRWHRFGAKLIRRKLSEVRDLAAPELVLSFCKSQLRRADVQNAQFPPSVALCREDFARWLKARERETRSEALTSPPAAPRAEKRPSVDVAAKAAAIAKLKAR